MVKKKVEIKEHVLLLKHVKLEEKNSEEILKKYNIVKNQLPGIYKKDPALKEFEELKTGDIIEITRNSPTANKVKFYRVVIDG